MPPFHLYANLLVNYQSFVVATVTWLTVTEYLCHKRPRLRFVSRYSLPVTFSFMTVTTFV